MLKKIGLTIVLISQLSFAQTYVKANAVTAIVLVPNLGIETSIANHYTFQADVMASLWKSVNNTPLQFVTITPEIRYHFKENYNGFYVGLHLGGGAFKLQKWNYIALNEYQEGYNYFIGTTVGYQKKISKKIILEAFLGGGNIQSFYKGYYIGSSERYEDAVKFNKSGEWLLYRGGIMICYKLN